MAARGYDPYAEAALKARFEALTGGRAAGNAQYDPKTPEYYADTAIGSSATVIPGYYGEDDLDEDGEYTSRGNFGPAPLTDIPTSSSNAARPRTVAAGFQLYVGEGVGKVGGTDYEERQGKLTVMFRDGTLYNYYGVKYEEWVTFRGALSKGKFLNWKPVPGFLLAKDHGPADLSQVSDKVQRTIQRVARAAQVHYTNRRATVTEFGGGDRKPGSKSIPRSVRGSVPKSASRKSGLGKAINPARNRGKNPH